MYPVSISSQHNYSHSSTHCLPPDTDMTLLLSVHSWIWQSHSTFSTRLTGCATAVTWSWWNVPVLHHTTVSSTKCGRISSFEVQSNMLWISFHSTFSHHPTKKTIKDLKKSLKSQNPFFKKTKRRRKEHKKLFLPGFFVGAFRFGQVLIAALVSVVTACGPPEVALIPVDWSRQLGSVTHATAEKKNQRHRSETHKEQPGAMRTWHAEWESISMSEQSRFGNVCTNIKMLLRLKAMGVLGKDLSTVVDKTHALYGKLFMMQAYCEDPEKERQRPEVTIKP